MKKIKIFYKNNKKERIYEYIECVVKMQALSGICIVCLGIIMFYIFPDISINKFLMISSIFSISMGGVALIIVVTN